MQGKTGYEQPVQADSTDVKIVLKKADALWFRQEVARRIEAAGSLSGLQKPENEAGGGQECAEEQNGAVRPAEDSEEYDVRGSRDVLRHGIFSISAVSVVIFIPCARGNRVQHGRNSAQCGPSRDGGRQGSRDRGRGADRPVLSVGYGERFCPLL